MPKTFYTERDIEDLSKRGVISLVEDDDVVLTDLARDKAMRLGIEIHPPAPKIPGKTPSNQAAQREMRCMSRSGQRSSLAWEIRLTPSCWKPSSAACCRTLEPIRGR